MPQRLLPPTGEELRDGKPLGGALSQRCCSTARFYSLQEEGMLKRQSKQCFRTKDRPFSTPRSLSEPYIHHQFPTLAPPAIATKGDANLTTGFRSPRWRAQLCSQQPFQRKRNPFRHNGYTFCHIFIALLPRCKQFHKNAAKVSLGLPRAAFYPYMYIFTQNYQKQS